VVALRADEAREALERRRERHFMFATPLQ
jgi:hypothetical protein